MKILHTSDWHVGRTIRGRSRVDEHRAVLSEIAEIAAAEQVDLSVVAGDLFDTAAPTPESEQVVYRALLELAQVSPVVVVAGNHDNPRRLEAVAPLLELGRVVVGARPTRPDEGGVVRFDHPPVRIALVPWVSQRGIVKAADLLAKDADEHAADYQGRLRSVIAALCADLTTDTVNLVVAHLTVHGAAASGSERTVHTVLDYGVPAGAFPEELSYVALGHYHRQQKMPAGPPVWYAGSPLQLDFGESDDRKGVLVVTAEPGLPATVENRTLQSGRRLIRLSGSLEEVATVAEGLGEQLEDSFVKVELDEVARVGLADDVRTLIPQVVDITLTRADRQRREEGSPSRLGREPRELFAEYLTSRGVEDDDLLRLFDELVEEAYET